MYDSIDFKKRENYREYTKMLMNTAKRYIGGISSDTLIDCAERIRSDGEYIEDLQKQLHEQHRQIKTLEERVLELESIEKYCNEICVNERMEKDTTINKLKRQLEKPRWINL